MVKLVLLLQPSGRRSRNGTTSGSRKIASADRRESERDAFEEDQAEARDQTDPAEPERRAGSSETEYREGTKPTDETKHWKRYSGENFETRSGQQKSQSREKVGLVHVRGEAGDSHEISGALFQSGTGNYLSSNSPESKYQATGTKIRVYQRVRSTGERRAAAQLLPREG